MERRTALGIVGASTTAALAGCVLPPSDSDIDFVDVTEFGAVGDGETDDSAALRDAHEAAREGGTVYYPSGTYLREYFTDNHAYPDGQDVALNDATVRAIPHQ